MKTDCSKQFTLNFPDKKEVRGQFNGGRLVTDAGLSLLREYEDDRMIFEQLSKCINDSRQPGKVQHLQPDVLRQRCYGIIAGYEDATDHDELATDPVFQMLNETFEDIDKDTGASQSTISRMENDITARSAVRLNKWLLEDFIERNKQAPPDEIILEIDPTDDPVHGNQQWEMFNGFYDQHMYFPLLVFDANSGDCLCARLRRGNAHAKDRALPHLKRIIRRLRESLEGITIKLRADAGFMDPKLYRMLEDESVQWAINLTKNSILREKTEDRLDELKKEYESREGDETLTSYREFMYQANSWQKPRRVCAKIQYGSKGANRRFVTTTHPVESPRAVFEFYEARGQCENYIKELKNGLFCDRLSCTRFIANSFRLLEHVIAYNLLNDFRKTVLNGTELENADIHTLRRKLFKVAARIRVTCRKIWMHLSESWPFREGFMQTAQALGCVP